MNTTKKNKKALVMIRADRAGVFYGILERKTGSEVELSDCRRVWQWAGAATLSQLAMEGTKTPQSCRFPQAVSSITILGVIEIIPVMKEAKATLDQVPVWKK